ncbi:hypothetical protein F7725_005920, partial [Dissostichus mawsoni]
MWPSPPPPTFASLEITLSAASQSPVAVLLRPSLCSERHNRTALLKNSSFSPPPPI